ncbi:MAG: T9SS type A sorting domain-containing protein [Sphingobacteriaceae bacterium]|nr:T9SS type A sorting domain-containing protein [Sphingobacteriaceae bacterium]
MKKLFTLLAVCALSLFSIAQSNQKIWTNISENSIRLIGKRQIIPQKYLTFSLNLTEMATKLQSAPLDSEVPINESNCIIYLPIANGEMQAFRVVEAPIMEKGLADAFPQIKTYSIKGIDDVYASGKLDINDFGFHGMIRSIHGDVFIDPYENSSTSNYISYYTKDFKKDPSHMLPEVGVIENPEYQNKHAQAPPATCVGANLRTYRLAVACTGEYAVAATGFASPTIAQALSRIVTSVNRVDGVYETDVAVRMVLVATETLVVFTAAASDPFTGNNNSGVLINESQTVCNANIGSANYDIGHTFSTGGGGLAQLGCVCGSSKARGITGSGSPVGDPYDIDYVAHEIGHQFGGNHTFNAVSSSCSGNRNASTSVEPGSGITIMAYAGICGTTNNLAPNSIAYFHAISYDEIVNFSNLGSGNSCANTTTTGNNPPVVTGPGTFNVPKSTPFSLTGTGVDPDGDPLTYSWEETDAGTAGGNWNSGNRPYFMSYTPTPSPTRLFPKLSVILSGNLTGTRGEYCPGTAQTLNFRLTARDNKMGGGGVCYVNQPVIIANSGPFNVTYPNAAGVIWAAGSAQTISWNVNGTDLSPVSCGIVDVMISYDGGNTFTTLMAGVANSGTLNITVPTPTATINTCRIKVLCPSNIFFDINDNNFTITTVTGLNELSSNNVLGLSVSPNPFTETFTINARNLGDDATLTITNVIGQILKKENVTGGNFSKEYNLSSFDSGIYFVTIKTKEHQSVARIIKQ